LKPLVARRLAFALLTLLSLGVAAYAVGVYGFLPLGAFVLPDMRTAYETHAVAIYAHVFASAAALALGPLQFVPWLRERHTRLHRWMGRLYLSVGVLVGGSSALYVSTFAYGGLGARAGFALLAACWLYTGLRAYRAIRGRDVAAHRRWMVRNFALTFAAVMLRLYMPAAVGLGIEFEAAYAPVAWLCWVPNLLVAELVIARRAVVARPLAS
jgi:uncharacterized membrane protein